MKGQNQGLIDSIIDSGEVTAVHPAGLTVRLQPDESCGSCPAAVLCRKDTAGANTVEISTDDASRYHVGQKVKVEITEGLHRKAIRLITIYPTLAILAVMTGLYLITGSQLTAAVSGMATMIFFFIILYLCRGRLQHEFNFRVMQ